MLSIIKTHWYCTSVGGSWEAQWPKTKLLYPQLLCMLYSCIATASYLSVCFFQTFHGSEKVVTCRLYQQKENSIKSSLEVAKSPRDLFAHPLDRKYNVGRSRLGKAAWSEVYEWWQWQWQKKKKKSEQKMQKFKFVPSTTALVKALAQIPGAKPRLLWCTVCLFC